MSIFHYLFDSEWSQRADIETLKEQNSALGSRLIRKVSTDVALEKRGLELELEIGELALISKTLMQILLEKEVFTGKELEDIMRKVDLADGVEDGRATKENTKPTQKCLDCNRIVQPKHKRCLYCGLTF